MRRYYCIFCGGIYGGKDSVLELCKKLGDCVRVFGWTGGWVESFKILTKWCLGATQKGDLFGVNGSKKKCTHQNWLWFVNNVLMSSKRNYFG